jgi:CHAD domain-containing protein
MTRRLRQTEAGVRGVRRVARKEIDAALDGLTKRSISDEDVHEARKLLKRTRAALRLVRPAVGDRAYRRDNAALRDAARPLSEIRDARILVDAFDAVAKGARLSDRRAWRPFRAGLAAERARRHATTLRRRGALRRIRKKLATARKRIGNWAGQGGGWEVLGAGLERVYRAGRKTFARARRKPAVARLHAWRKQVKYLWHQLQLIEPIWPAILRDLGDQAHRLSDLLGDDHDLAMLEERLRRSPARPRGAAGEKLASRIATRRAALESKAVTLGARLYEESPRAFVERLAGYWRAWRAEGRSPAKANGGPYRSAGRRLAKKSARAAANGRALHL